MAYRSTSGSLPMSVTVLDDHERRQEPAVPTAPSSQSVSTSQPQSVHVLVRNGDHIEEAELADFDEGGYGELRSILPGIMSLGTDESGSLDEKAPEEQGHAGPAASNAATAAKRKRKKKKKKKKAKGVAETQAAYDATEGGPAAPEEKQATALTRSGQKPSTYATLGLNPGQKRYCPFEGDRYFNVFSDSTAGVEKESAPTNSTSTPHSPPDRVLSGPSSRNQQTLPPSPPVRKISELVSHNTTTNNDEEIASSRHRERVRSGHSF